MKNLAAWYHWNERRSLLQAIDIAKNNKVDFNEIKRWSKEEGNKEATLYESFIKQLHNIEAP